MEKEEAYSNHILRPQIYSPVAGAFEPEMMDQSAECSEQFYAQHLANLENLIEDQKAEIQTMSAEDLKNYNLPLARVKKIMKSDEDVRMISAEAPILFSKACELFIIELTHRSWIHAVENRRRTLQKSDIAISISKTDIFDFLMDVVLNEEDKPVPDVEDAENS